MDRLETLFPGLSGSGYVITSPADDRYNGIAWAAQDTGRWWWPADDSDWPEGVPREGTIGAFIAAYGEFPGVEPE